MIIRPLRDGILPLKDVVRIFGRPPTEILNITRYAASWVGVSLVRIEGLSSCRHEPKGQKYYKPFVPETTESGCVRFIGPVGRVFANDPGHMSSITGRVIPNTLKMVLDTSYLNTQQYKVSIEGEVEQSREQSSALPYTSV